LGRVVGHRVELADPAAVIVGPVEDFRIEVGGLARVGRLVNIGSAGRVVVVADQPPPRPAELPAALADFTGRVQELAHLGVLCAAMGYAPGAEKSAAPGALAIAGPPGVGKSALALRLAHDLASKYPDGQLYRDLRGSDTTQVAASAVLGHFLRALGVRPGEVPDDPAERAALYRTLLADRRVLVLLDNASDEAQVRPLLPAGTGSAVLVTCRNPLPALEGATTYQLDVLDRDEAVALLSRVAGPDRIGADPTGSKDIVEHCGRLPLAVRIAAARLRARSDWNPADVARRLADARRRLCELHIGDLDVRVCFELSYRDLDVDAARLFRRLSLVPGPTFSVELASVLSDLPESETESLLDRLVLDQLVAPVVCAGQYQVHYLLRLFAFERFTDAGEDYEQLMESVLGWYAVRLDRAAGGVLVRPTAPGRPNAPADPPAAALAWLDTEAINLGFLLTLSDHLGVDWYTAAIAHPIGVYAQHCGLRAEWAATVNAGLAAARRLGARPQQAGYLSTAGSGAPSWTTGHQRWSAGPRRWS
jgi:hypothetical protein